MCNCKLYVGEFHIIPTLWKSLEAFYYHQFYQAQFIVSKSVFWGIRYTGCWIEGGGVEMLLICKQMYVEFVEPKSWFIAIRWNNAVFVRK